MSLNNDFGPIPGRLNSSRTNPRRRNRRSRGVKIALSFLALAGLLTVSYNVVNRLLNPKPRIDHRGLTTKIRLPRRWLPARDTLAVIQVTDPLGRVQSFHLRLGKTDRVSNTGIDWLDRAIESVMPFQSFARKPDYNLHPSDQNNPLVASVVYPQRRGDFDIQIIMHHNPNGVSHRTVVVQFRDPETRQQVGNPIVSEVQLNYSVEKLGNVSLVYDTNSPIHDARDFAKKIQGVFPYPIMLLVCDATPNSGYRSETYTPENVVIFGQFPQRSGNPYKWRDIEAFANVLKSVNLNIPLTENEKQVFNNLVKAANKFVQMTHPAMLIDSTHYQVALRISQISNSENNPTQQVYELMGYCIELFFLDPDMYYNSLQLCEESDSNYEKNFGKALDNAMKTILQRLRSNSNDPNEFENLLDIYQNSALIESQDSN